MPRQHSPSKHSHTASGPPGGSSVRGRHPAPPPAQSGGWSVERAVSSRANIVSSSSSSTRVWAARTPRQQQPRGVSSSHTVSAAVHTDVAAAAAPADVAKWAKAPRRLSQAWLLAGHGWTGRGRTCGRTAPAVKRRTTSSSDFLCGRAGEWVVSSAAWAACSAARAACSAAWAACSTARAACSTARAACSTARAACSAAWAVASAAHNATSEACAADGMPWVQRRHADVH